MRGYISLSGQQWFSVHTPPQPTHIPIRLPFPQLNPLIPPLNIPPHKSNTYPPPTTKPKPGPAMLDVVVPLLSKLPIVPTAEELRPCLFAAENDHKVGGAWI